MKKNTDSSMGNENKKKLNDFMKAEKKKEALEEKAKKKLEKEKKKLEEKSKQAKEKTEKVKSELKERKRIFDQLKGIRIKILGAFFVPVILLAVFGVVSYQQSSKAIITNYEKSTTDTLNAVSKYLGLGFKSVQDKAIEFSLSNTVENYYRRVNEKDTLDNVTALRQLQEEVIVIRETNKFINAIHIMAGVGTPVSTFATPPKDLFKQYTATDEAKKIMESSSRNVWVGTHDAMDEQLKMSKDEYSMALVSKLSYSSGLIMMDVSMEEVMNVLKDIDTADGSIIGFVTADGREELTDENLKDVYTDTKYYKDAVASEEPSDYTYVDYNGEKYLFLYSKVGDTGSMVCALVPKAEILKQSRAIRDLSMIFITVASILAILLGTIIASGIGNAIAKLVKSISLAARGDLTAKFSTKRKDEFKVLSDGLADMTSGMSNLIGEVAGVGTKVTESADLLSVTSEKILGATKDISFTIDEIEKGVVQQAEDTEHCLGQMANLSDKINQVYSSTYEIEKIANNTKGIVGDGLIIIDELNDKSKATTDVTQVVIKDIEALEVQSRNIGNFVGIINEIASQTNLLSLNASIEAARAGDAGRGFAVVADEIRKLADQSIQAASQIQGIVTEIQNKTQGTVVSAKQAENIVESQTESLTKTIKVFEDINKHVGSLVTNLDNISIGIKGIETAKEVSMDAIRNISAVAQQTAAASEEVSATANGQISSVENLSSSALELAGDAKKLEQAIQLFKI
ncbi:methyl-accepting chemotaxis protein [Anaerocolumna sp. AGMB13025]|uniref:methyl-accepting chemotaxis protein n=1 Tax=Anaerocolumna sp. AGMB13025 TaxID=3039116 RepID=UPI00241D403C|nr:methyl-accepting chemotaxis protein [Anaerocolumna sp. AGMB13025]WFR58263.1 methyl-accepting chemotaxis protein [Anaerocolumna sp. AGMB13025]